MKEEIKQIAKHYGVHHQLVKLMEELGKLIKFDPFNEEIEMLRQLISKWGIMNIDLQNAIENDMAVIEEDRSRKYVENDADYFTSELVEVIDAL